MRKKTETQKIRMKKGRAQAAKRCQERRALKPYIGKGTILDDFEDQEAQV